MSRDLCNGMLAGAQDAYERERFGDEPGADLHPLMRAAFRSLWAMPRGEYPTAKFPEGLPAAAVFVEQIGGAK